MNDFLINSFNPMDEITNIVCYLRRSRQDIEKERRTGEDTLTDQRMIMQRILEYYPMPNDIVEEIGSGDRIDTRPIFQRVINWLESGRYNAIAVKEIARLGRGSYADMGKIFDTIKNKRIFIITPYKIYNIENPSDAQQIRFELFFAKEEYEKIKDRLTTGKLNAAWRGKYMAVPPYGYITDDNYNLVLDKAIRDEQGNIIDFEGPAKIVQNIFNWFLYGVKQFDGTFKEVGIRGIVAHLNALGITPPDKNSKSGLWNYFTVRRMLQSDCYIGTYRYRQTRKVSNNKYVLRPENEWIVHEDNHDSIISRDMWEMVQIKRENIHTLHTTRDYSPGELAGIVVCADCGKKMTRYTHEHKRQKKNGEYSYYNAKFMRCHTKGCPTSLVKYDHVEESILIALQNIRYFSHEEFMLNYKTYFEEQIVVQDAIDVAKILHQKLKELNNERDFIFEQYEKKFYNENDFQKRLTKKDKQIEEVNNELLRLNSDEAEIVNNSPPDMLNSPNVRKKILKYKDDLNILINIYKNSTTREQKNRILRYLIEVVELKKIGKGRGSKFDIRVIPKIFLDASCNVLPGTY